MDKERFVLNVYRVRVSAVYYVESVNDLGAPLKALCVMREEIIRCPENMSDFDTKVSLISESV